MTKEYEESVVDPVFKTKNKKRFSPALNEERAGKMDNIPVISGAMNAGVPTAPVTEVVSFDKYLDTPKSQSLTFPSLSIKIFSGFRSRWATLHHNNEVMKQNVITNVQTVTTAIFKIEFRKAGKTQ